MKKDRKMGTIFFLITWVLFCWTSGGFWGIMRNGGSIMSRFTFLGYQIRIWFTSYSTEIRMAIPWYSLGLARLLYHVSDAAKRSS